MTQSRSSGPKQERRRRSRHGTSWGCLQPDHDDEDICTVWHCSDRVRDPVELTRCLCVRVAGIHLPWELRAQQLEKFSCEGDPAVVGRRSLSRVRGGLAVGVRVQVVRGLLAARWGTVAKRGTVQITRCMKGMFLSI